MCSISVCPNNGIAASVWDFYNVHTDADACDCTRGLCGHRKRVCTGSWLWEKNPLLSQYRAWLLSRTLYQLSNSRLVKCKWKQGAVMLLNMIILSLQTRVPILPRNKTKTKQKKKKKRRRKKEEEEEETSHCRVHMYSCKRALYSDVIFESYGSALALWQWSPIIRNKLVSQIKDGNSFVVSPPPPPHTPHNSAH